MPEFGLSGFGGGQDDSPGDFKSRRVTQTSKEEFLASPEQQLKRSKDGPASRNMSSTQETWSHKRRRKPGNTGYRGSYASPGQKFGGFDAGAGGGMGGSTGLGSERGKRPGSAGVFSSEPAAKKRAVTSGAGTKAVVQAQNVIDMTGDSSGDSDDDDDDEKMSRPMPTPSVRNTNANQSMSATRPSLAKVETLKFHRGLEAVAAHPKMPATVFKSKPPVRQDRKSSVPKTKFSLFMGCDSPTNTLGSKHSQQGQHSPTAPPRPSLAGASPQRALSIASSTSSPAHKNAMFIQESSSDEDSLSPNSSSRAASLRRDDRRSASSPRRQRIQEKLDESKRRREEAQKKSDQQQAHYAPNKDEHNEPSFLGVPHQR